MAVAKYPEYLPLPLQDGYALQHVSPLQRSELVSGRTRQRRRYTSVPTMVKVQWFFEDSGKLMLFEGWFRHIITDGADWADIPIQTPLGIREYRCRFADMYSGPSLVSVDTWTISATLEIVERPIIDEGWVLYYPAGLAYASIIDHAVNRLWPK